MTGFRWPSLHEPRRRRRIPALLSLGSALLLALGLGACEHPLGVVTPHVEAADLLVHDGSGTLLARTDFNRTWSVPRLTLTDGSPRQLRLVPVDFRSEPIDVAARSDLSFRVEAEDGALVQWEPQRGFGWLRPFGTGTTRIRFLIWHGDHADFVTPWLEIRIQPASLEAP